MVTSLRLGKQLEQWIAQAARLAGMSKSEFIRQRLEDCRQADVARPSAYELGKDLFGGQPSGRTDLAANSKRIVREKIHAKARRT